jgi:hypothetical protein
MLSVPIPSSSFSPPHVGKVSARRIDCPNGDQGCGDIEQSKSEPPPRLFPNRKDERAHRSETREHGQSDGGSPRRLTRTGAKDGRTYEPTENEPAQTERGRSGGEVEDKRSAEDAPEGRCGAPRIHPHSLTDVCP